MAGTYDPIIGIDLGTTYSCVAVFRNGQPEVIDNQGERVTPSMVAFTDHDQFVGIAAMNQASTNPENTVSEVKRLIGRNINDPSVKEDIKLWPFQVVKGINDDKPMIRVNHKGKVRLLTAEEISAYVLIDLKEAAESRLGCKVKNVVVTVPAYFNDAQRCATRDAATIAGLNVLRIINEPTAAALAYGLGKVNNRQEVKKNIVIFDLGGGTFDVSILEINNDMLEVKATLGDTHLGGADFDNRLLKHFAKELNSRQGLDASSNPKVLRRLRFECEKTKKTLSRAAYATLHADFATGDFISKISRAKFDDLCMDLYEKCIDVVERCLRDAYLDKRSIDDVVLVGGSSRIPTIQQMLCRFFDKTELCNSVNPEEAVACGAAIQAAMLRGGDHDGATASSSRASCSTPSVKPILTLKDVTPLSLGIEVAGGGMSVVVPKNTPIPCHKQQVFKNAYNKQPEVNFRVYEGEMVTARENNMLGEFRIGGFKPRSEGKVHFDTTFDIDANGILNVSAIERSSKISASIIITDHRGRLTAKDKNRMANEARAYTIEKQRKEQMAASEENLESFAYNLKTKMEGLGLESSQRKMVFGLIDETLGSPARKL